jgi:hypothetical protein
MLKMNIYDVTFIKIWGCLRTLRTALFYLTVFLTPFRCHSLSFFAVLEDTYSVVIVDIGSNSVFN